MSVDSTIRKAQKLAKAGDRDAAVALLKQVLAKSPGNRTAQRGLAALTRAAAAESPSVRPSTRPSPAGQNPTARALREVEVRLKRGDTAGAIAEAQRLSLLFPASAPVFNLLGIALTRAGRRDAAVKAFSRLAELSPKDAGARFNMANALFAVGRFAAAAEAAAAALRIKPNLFQAARLRGFALMQAGRPDDAEDAFRAAIRMSPDVPQGHLGLGHLLTATGRPAEALAAYEAAHARDPSNAEAANNVGAMLIANDRLHEAVETLGHAIELHPKHRKLRSNIAKALRDLNRAEEALTHVEAALEIGPVSADLLGLKGTCQVDLGDIEAGRATLRKAVELDPENPDALARAWKQDPVPIDHPDRSRMDQFLEHDRLPEMTRAKLAFALFKGHDAADDIDGAAAYLSRGNALQRQAHPYDIEAQARMFDALKAGFERAAPVLAERDITAVPARQRMVFIVGMPRSGTSLVEQILASHSQVHAAGELRFLNNAMREIGWRDGEIGGGPTQDNLRRLRRSYLDRIDRLGVDEPVVTDKMPLNFRYVGHALAAFPEARVLVLARDARAVCWSNWVHDFRGRANGFGNDMTDLARMYRMHEALLAVYRSAYPDRIADVPYERLTEHQEEESRKLVAAAGLDWEPACLDFHQTKRAVRTASAVQVRQGMYTGSSDAWRRYEAHLGPLLEALERGD